MPGVPIVMFDGSTITNTNGSNKRKGTINDTSRMQQKSISEKSNFSSSFEEITYYETKERILKENRSYSKRDPAKGERKSRITSNLIIPIKIESNNNEEKKRTSASKNIDTKATKSKISNQEEILRAEPIYIEVDEGNLNNMEEEPGVFSRKLTYTISKDETLDNDPKLKVYPKKSSIKKASSNTEGSSAKKPQMEEKKRIFDIDSNGSSLPCGKIEKNNNGTNVQQKNNISNERKLFLNNMVDQIDSRNDKEAENKRPEEKLNIKAAEITDEGKSLESSRSYENDNEQTILTTNLETLEIPKVEQPSIRNVEKLNMKQGQKEHQNGKKYLETVFPINLADEEDKVDQSHLNKSKSDKSVAQIEVESGAARRARQIKFDWLQNNTKHSDDHVNGKETFTNWRGRVVLGEQDKEPTNVENKKSKEEPLSLNSIKQTVSQSPEDLPMLKPRKKLSRKEKNPFLDIDACKAGSNVDTNLVTRDECFACDATTQTRRRKTNKYNWCSIC